jgi:hypothetical protein
MTFIIILSRVGILSYVKFPKNFCKYLSLSNKFNVVIGILILYFNTTGLPGKRAFLLIFFPQTDLPRASISPTGVNVSSFLAFTESDNFAPNILVSKTKPRFSLIGLSLQQILNCFMKYGRICLLEKY